MGRVRLLVWSIPLLLLTLTLGLHMTLGNAVERNQAMVIDAARATAVEAVVVDPVAPAAPPPILQAELPIARDAQALAYLSALDEPRATPTRRGADL